METSNIEPNSTSQGGVTPTFVKIQGQEPVSLSTVSRFTQLNIYLQQVKTLLFGGQAPENKQYQIKLHHHYLACLFGIIVGAVNAILAYHFLHLALPELEMSVLVLASTAAFLCNTLTFTVGIAESLAKITHRLRHGSQEASRYTLKQHVFQTFFKLHNVASGAGMAFTMFTFGYAACQQVLQIFNITGATAQNIALFNSIGFATSLFLKLVGPSHDLDDDKEKPKKKKPEHLPQVSLIFIRLISLLQSAAMLVSIGTTAMPVLFALLPPMAAYGVGGYIALTSLHKNHTALYEPALIKTSQRALITLRDIQEALTSLNKSHTASHNSALINTKQSTLTILHNIRVYLGFFFSQLRKNLFTFPFVKNLFTFLFVLLNAWASAVTTQFAWIPYPVLRHGIVGNGFIASMLLNLNSAKDTQLSLNSWPENSHDQERLLWSLLATLGIVGSLLLVPSIGTTTALAAGGFCTALVVLNLGHYAELRINPAMALNQYEADILNNEEKNVRPDIDHPKLEDNPSQEMRSGLTP